ncbi:ABC transporter ATP-binding protein [Micromonospora krabiensis]|uniref:Branched-chain amino acid transport system ATP-binding protein n=1 Tax=Micromonospora krabiensis TaxID=307121 RepID=A0A1C3MYM4_9ACTN|nr:ABC transporter ATP-binding protein [Micromonospora krabiensis]SBV25419.1 branched-chain amino acid transport system ATP-binding protein [Micromonospora krabiensis]
MLRLERVSAGYHGGTVLHDVTLQVTPGCVQAVVGRNGAGKSTLVHTIAGLVRPYTGRIEIGGVPVAGRQPHRIARSGVGLVPQGRRVFSRLTVAEHLVLAAAPWRAATPGAECWTVARILDLLPRLAARLRHRGDQLSGGEQQMLAIARALLGQPRVLLLDEPSEGLAPDLADRVRDLVGGLAATGLTVLLVEQQLHHAIEVADRVAVLEYGRLVYDRPTAEARADPATLAAMLSIATVATPPAPGPAADFRADTPQVPRPPSKG